MRVREREWVGLCCCCCCCSLLLLWFSSNQSSVATGGKEGLAGVSLAEKRPFLAGNKERSTRRCIRSAEATQARRAVLLLVASCSLRGDVGLGWLTVFVVSVDWVGLVGCVTAIGW